jgi:hypothetical protein
MVEAAGRWRGGSSDRRSDARALLRVRGDAACQSSARVAVPLPCLLRDKRCAAISALAEIAQTSNAAAPYGGVREGPPALRLDLDHSGPGCRRAIEGHRPKVRPGGRPGRALATGLTALGSLSLEYREALFADPGRRASPNVRGEVNVDRLLVAVELRPEALA